MRAGAGFGKASDQQVRPVAIGRRAVVLDEDVVTDDRRLRSLRHAGEGRAIELVFDLHAISEGIEDEVVFDDSGDERAAAVAIPEINPGAGADDRVVPDYPIPGGCLGRDPVSLLTAASADDHVSVQHDVMRGDMHRAWRLDAVAAYAKAVDCKIADNDVAGIDDLDGTVPDLASNYRARSCRRAGHSYAMAGRAVAVGNGQWRISAGCEQQGIAGLQRREQLLVIRRVCAQNPPLLLSDAKVLRRCTALITRRHRGRHRFRQTEAKDGDRQSDEEEASPHPVMTGLPHPGVSS